MENDITVTLSEVRYKQLLSKEKALDESHGKDMGEFLLYTDPAWCSHEFVTWVGKEEAIKELEKFHAKHENDLMKRIDYYLAESRNARKRWWQKIF